MPRTPPRPPARPRPTVAVVGGGIAGLAAAWQLTGGSAGPGPDSPEVVVLEAAGRLGGKLRTVTIGDVQVDVGPDAFLGRRPEAVELCAELGLGPEMAPIAAAGAQVWARGRRRTLPDGLVMGVPTRFWPLARSGVLSVRADLRVLVDVVFPRPDVRGPIGDRAVGPLIAHKLGRSVVDMLVDPLIGGINAGGVADMSTAAVFPLLLAVAQRRASFMKSLRRAAGRTPGTPGRSAGPAPADATDDGGNTDDEGDEGTRPGGAEPPMFWALRGGLSSLVDRLEAALVARGVTIRTVSPVEVLDRADGPVEVLDRADGPAPWVLHTAAGPLSADAVVLALPAGAAARLLGPHDTDAATLLGGIDYASVGIVTLSYPEDAAAAALTGTGLLVPHKTPSPPGLGDPLLVTACSYLSSKWPYLAGAGELLVRASVGRFGDTRFESMPDDELAARVAGELETLVGLKGAPTRSMVTRWPSSFPQYRVHHLLRVAGIEAAVKRLPALAVAGAAYRGVGIPACVASGRAAARAVLESLAVAPDTAGPPT